MGAFASKQVVTIRDEKNWEAWEAVTIKAKQSLADEAWVQNHMVRTETSKGKSNDMLAQIGTVKQKLLERMIVSWTFTDENHNPVPHTAQAIGELDTAYADFIYDEINKRNQPMDEEEQKSFLSVVSAPIEGQA